MTEDHHNSSGSKPDSRPDQSDDPIEFPSELTVKAMGLASPDFQQLVSNIVNTHLDDGTPAEVSTLQSSKGKYVSVRVRFVAQNRPQLESIYRDLHASDRVLYTL